MKRIIAIILICISLSFFVSCKNETEYSTYSVTNPGGSYEKFLQDLSVSELETTDNFYVLATQDYRNEKGFQPKWGLKLYNTWSNKDAVSKKECYVDQAFYVCNEEKYGRQVTDYGQYGGIAINFYVQSRINALYTPQKGEEIIVKFGY